MVAENWKIILLGEALTFQRGFDITREQQKAGPYPVFSSSGPKSTHSEFMVRGPGVIVGRKGSLGTVFYSDGDYWPHDTTLWVKDFHNNDPKFAYYYLQTMGFERYDAGASNPTLNRNHIHTIPVHWPPLPIQRRIAGILSAYDELIENNQRRIKILEEMARSLYREWFVLFRFPGHDKVKMVPSPLGPIPQGWEAKEMQEVADVIDCLHSKKPEECPDGSGVLLQLNNIGAGGKLDMRELFRISTKDYELWTSRIELMAGDCIVTNVGRVGAVAQIPDGVKVAPGRNMTAIRPCDGQLTPTFLVEYLMSSHMASEVAKKKDLGTIMDSLNVKGIVRLYIPCPPIDFMLKFERIARPMRKRVEVLADQIQNLRHTRDLLLPRLLSGAIELANTGISATQEIA